MRKRETGMRRAFTLVEMLVVLGIIAILVGVSVGGFSSMTKAADKTRAQELVNNTAAALSALFLQEGAWPKRLLKEGATDGKLDAETAYALVAGSTKFMSLTVKDGKLAGLDRLGIVSPWATAVIKRKGNSASLSDKVGSKTIEDHLLHYALDLDGDGVIKGAMVGGAPINVRATAIVWCAGKDGVMSAYPYGGGTRSAGGQEVSKGPTDDVYSWTPGQTKEVE